MELKVPGNGLFLRPGDVWDDVDATAIKREMIRRTIKEHLDKEECLRPLGVRVLSLFFIDAVDKCRQYDAEDNLVKGLVRGDFRGRVQALRAAPAGTRSRGTSAGTIGAGRYHWRIQSR